MTSLPAGFIPHRYSAGSVCPGQESELQRLQALVGTWQCINVRLGHPSPKVELLGYPVGRPCSETEVHHYDVNRGTPVWLRIERVETDNGWPIAWGRRDDSLYGFRPDHLYRLLPLSLQIGG